DDYFHVNWGWGGESDGHFKLSVLYSDKQGIGGSTSQDGYSSDQEAIINVNPVNSGVDVPERMTAVRVASEKNEYTRGSSSEDFDVRLYCAMYNYTGVTNSFDIGWGLYNGDVLLNVIGQDYVNDIPDHFGLPNYSLGCQFGSGLDGGEYLLKPISKIRNTGTWYADWGSEIYYIKATISGNTLTLESSALLKMAVKETTVTTAIEDRQVGKPVTITAKLQNDGTLYSGDVSIGVANDGSYNLLASQQVELAAGEEQEVTFTFTPTAAGEMNIYVLVKDKMSISDDPIAITVLPSSATTGTLAIDWKNDITFDNAAGANWYNGFYGSKILGHVKVTNNSTTHAHTSGLLIRLWKKYNGDDYSFWDSYTCATNIVKNGGTQTFDFVFDELEVGTSYLVTYHYTNPETTEISVPHYILNAQYGVTTIAADGTETTEAPKASVTTPDEALALDISHLAIVTTVTPNSNPNTVYIVGNSVPSGLDGKNVVQNGTAATLTLQDGHGFYTPMAFTATNVTYTRTFTTGADGTNGWSTIVLPFDVAQVKQGDKVIDWFHSSKDTGKHFWVKNFSSEDGSTVNFDYVNQMKADTPYIIAVPGSTWGESWNLTNKEITFYGADATIESGTLASVSGNQYKFAGTKQAKAVTDCYVMNNEGSAFSKTSTTVAPFRAYFSPLTMMAGQPAAAALYIGSEGNNPTGITEMTYDRQETKGAAYNLNGQRVAHPRKGLYIVDGKKVIMK
ncbi:MAG: hypothetical protein J6Z18_09160, partial [Prevotella sp.]|nr:hypothetical protein [Prevotella sp.]